MSLDDLVTSLCAKYTPDNNDLQQCVKNLKRKLNCVDDDDPTILKKPRLQCDLCSKTFSTPYSLRRHKTLYCKNRNKKFPCQHCSEVFSSCSELFKHVQGEHIVNQKGSGRKKMKRRKRKTRDETALKGNAKVHSVFPKKDERYDLITFFANVKEEVEFYLRKKSTSGQLKWYMVVHVHMLRKRITEESEIAKPFFRSETTHVLMKDDESLDHNINAAFQKMFKAFDSFIQRGSSWTLKRVLQLDIYTASYKAIGGRSYVQLPAELRNSKSVINIKNKDQKCFLWSVLASLHPAATHSERVGQYKRFQNELDMSGINYPVHPTSMSKFERQNDISVTVIGYENKQLFPLYISKMKDSRHSVELLYITKDNQRHWCWIKNFNRFLYHTKPPNHSYHFCRYCLQSFPSKANLNNHQQYCSQHSAQGTSFPTKDVDDVLQFSDFKKQMPVGFVIYFDFETLNRRMDTCYPNPTVSSTTKDAKCEPCGFAFKTVCIDPRYTQKTVVYRGENVARTFLSSLLNERDRIKKILSNIEPMAMTPEEEIEFQNAENCHICENKFTQESVKVRDHCHISGKFRGASCRGCNLNFKQSPEIPVISHGLSNFDSHIICEAIGFFKKENIKCLARSSERYISFSLSNLKFIDSYQFLGASLEELIQSSAKDGGLTNFELLSREVDKAQLLLRKGVYPYDYMDSFDKFKETRLPNREKFYNNLSKSQISQSDYEYAQQVWKEFDIKNMGEYHDLYLKTDVLTLACIFENFRKISMNYYKLDPAHFVSLPGLSWQACLKMTKVKLELLTDPDMYLFFEKGIRGGLSVISKRYVEANNPYLKDTYDNEKSHSYIMYQDCTNLYGKAMMMKLPVGNFRWLEEEERNAFELDKKTENDDTGYVLEVDLEYPKEYHKHHNDYPLAPEKREITNDMLSPYTKKLFEHLQDKHVSSTKLIASLENKTKYVLDYRALQLYVRLGLKLTKIHKILSFRQSSWLRTYIDFNTQKRKECSSEFLRSFFKLMNNSVYGKFLENVRKHMQFNLVHRENDFRKHTAKSNFEQFTIFNKDLVGINSKIVKLKLNKPIYCGMVILDLSKVVMYSYYYDHVKRKYGENVTLCATDTDSLLMEVKTKDLYKDMMNCKHLFDLSNYDKNHFLYDISNKGKIGTFKDETKGLPIHLFCGLRAKMYAYTCPTSKQTKEQEHLTAKGVKKSTIKTDLTFKKYFDCLFNKTRTKCNFHLIKSDKHKLYIDRLNKTGLCAGDDKRWIMDDGIRTLAHGHYKTKRFLKDNM